MSATLPAAKAAQQPGLFQAVKSTGKTCGQWTITKVTDLGKMIASIVAKVLKGLSQVMHCIKDHIIKIGQSTKEFVIANPQYFKALGIGLVLVVVSFAAFKCCKKNSENTEESGKRPGQTASTGNSEASLPDTQVSKTSQDDAAVPSTPNSITTVAQDPTTPNTKTPSSSELLTPANQ